MMRYLYTAALLFAISLWAMLMFPHGLRQAVLWLTGLAAPLLSWRLASATKRSSGYQNRPEAAAQARRQHQEEQTRYEQQSAGLDDAAHAAEARTDAWLHRLRTLDGTRQPTDDSAHAAEQAEANPRPSPSSQPPQGRALKVVLLALSLACQAQAQSLPAQTRLPGPAWLHTRTLQTTALRPTLDSLEAALRAERAIGRQRLALQQAHIHVLDSMLQARTLDLELSAAQVQEVESQRKLARRQARLALGAGLLAGLLGFSLR